MTVKQLQKTIDNWIKNYGIRYFDPLPNLAILTEEFGEVARIISLRY
ncbi:MAG: pyrophosphatase, partial [Bacteroidia bacterium]